MRIAILTIGTLGDLDLFLGLGQALKADGAEVSVGTSSFYAERVRAAGLSWTPVGNGTFGDLQAQVHAMSATHDPIERTRIFYRRWIRRELAGAGQQLQQLAGEADLFISNLKLFLNRGETRIPAVFVDYDPPVNQAEFGRLGIHEESHRRSTLDLVAMSKELVDPDDTWAEQYQFTGFWRGPAIDDGWTPPADLENFISNGEAPVVATFGSMATFDVAEFVRVFQASLAALGQRGIVIGGWSKLPPAATMSSPDLHAAEYIPYDWLFARAACVIHHGGTGTVASVLRAGCPSILFPQIATQHQYAELLTREGICTGVFDAGNVTIARLTESISNAVNDEGVRARVLRWQRKVSQEDGLGSAVTLIASHVRRCRSENAS